MLVRFFSLFLLLLTSAVAFAQPLPDRFPLEGFAVDGAGKPLVGALVSIRRQDGNGSYAFWSATTLTDARGEFHFPSAETGSYYLNIEPVGFVPLYNESINWKNGAAPLHFKFDRLVSLRVTLVKADGTPVANTPVWARLRGDGSTGQTSQRFTTDANGQLRIGDLPQGNFSVYLFTDDGFAFVNGLAIKTDVEQKLTLQKGGAVRLKIQDGSNPPRAVGGALMVLSPESVSEAVRLMGPVAEVGDDFGFLAALGERLRLVSRDGDGVIQVSNVPPGSYTAKVTPTGYAPISIPVQITAGETVDLPVNLTPKPSPKASLTLQLTEFNGQPASGEIALRILPLNENGTLATEEFSEDNPVGSSAGRRARADAAGQITLFPFKPGRYRVFANHFKPGLDGATESASVDVLVPQEGLTASLVLKASP